MKRLKFLGFLVSVVLVLVLVACASPAPTPAPAPAPAPTPAPAPVATPPAQPGQVKELTISLTCAAVAGRHVNVTQPWMDEIAKRTNGRIKIVPFFSDSLVKHPEAYDAVTSGMCDIIQVCSDFNPGRFPMSDVTKMPTMGQVCDRGSRVIWELYKNFPKFKDEYSETKVLFLSTMPVANLVTRKPVRTLEDLRGMKMIAAGEWNIRQLELLGASGISIAWPEVYQTLEKGVADGVATNLDSICVFRFNEVAKYITDMPLWYANFMTVMNKNTWNSLPPDIQKVFDDVSGDIEVDAWDKFHTNFVKQCNAASAKDKGVQFIQLAPDELARWNKLIVPVRDEYISRLDKMGLQGKQLVAEYDRLLKEWASK